MKITESTSQPTSRKGSLSLQAPCKLQRPSSGPQERLASHVRGSIAYSVLLTLDWLRARARSGFAGRNRESIPPVGTTLENRTSRESEFTEEIALANRPRRLRLE